MCLLITCTEVPGGVGVVDCCVVAQSCPALCDPMDCNSPGSLVLHYFPELAQTQVHRVRMPSNHLILCRPLLLLPPVFPSMRGFFNESVLPIKWPKYWSFSFSISPNLYHFPNSYCERRRIIIHILSPSHNTLY